MGGSQTGRYFGSGKGLDCTTTCGRFVCNKNTLLAMYVDGIYFRSSSELLQCFLNKQLGLIIDPLCSMVKPTKGGITLCGIHHIHDWVSRGVETCTVAKYVYMHYLWKLLTGMISPTGMRCVLGEDCYCRDFDGSVSYWLNAFRVGTQVPSPA